MGKFIKEMGLAAMMLAVSGVSASGKGNTRYYQAAVDTDAVWVATSEGLMRFDKSTGEQNTFASQGIPASPQSQWPTVWYSQEARATEA